MKTKRACPLASLKPHRSGPARRGSALLLATILLFVVLSMVVSLTYVTVMEQKMSGKMKSSVGSFFNADSGVEWALNKIANVDGGLAIGSGGAFNDSDISNGVACPFGGCDLYFLDENGKVITDGATKKISDIKAVRSVGAQTAGEPTQRAIEAAVASGKEGCYVDYNLAEGLSAGASCTVSGFTVKGSAGSWGFCEKGDGIGDNKNTRAFFCPPGNGLCSRASGWSQNTLGEAYVCCL
jgi:hypothetical protein